VRRGEGEFQEILALRATEGLGAYQAPAVPQQQIVSAQHHHRAVDFLVVHCAGERASLSPKAARRYDSFLKQSPAGTHNDALWYARASREQRQRYKATRRAG
jgi:hypothetical protein